MKKSDTWAYGSIFEYFDTHLSQEAQDEDYQRARSEYNRLYRKQQQVLLRQKHRTIAIHLSPQKYLSIQEAAVSYGVKTATFVRLCCLQHPAIIPPKLKHECLRLLGNAQTLAEYDHTPSEHEELIQHLNDLHQLLSQFLA